MSPFFLNITKEFDPIIRHKIAYRVAIYCAILLLCTLFIGRFVLLIFGITLPFIQIAGGILVFYTGWEMLTAKHDEQIDKASNPHHHEVAFFPLTMPITAGAGSIAAILAIAGKIDENHGTSSESLMLYLGTLLGIASVCVLVAICYRFSDTLFSKLGHTGTNIMTRISAFILLAIGVEIMWTGLRALILSV